MSTALNDSPTREHIPSSKHTQNSLTAGQMPRWVWAVVAAAALLVALGLELLIKGEEFRVARLAVMTLISYVVGMYIVTRLLENRRKATDGLWRNLVWAAFLIALVPLVSVIWSVISDGAPTLFGNPQVLWNDMDGVTGTTDAAYLNDGQPLGGLPGGFAHALVGTLMITLIATLIAVPIGLLTSIYLVEYGQVQLVPDRGGSQQDDPLGDRPELPGGLRHPTERTDRRRPHAVHHHAGGQHGRPVDREQAQGILGSQLMSTALNDSPTREHIPSSKHTQNSLTAGQMPRWVWAVVAAAALLVALGLELLIKGEEFRVARLAVMTLISYVVGMYIVTRLLENRRKATDGLWRNLVWAAFLIALVPLVSVIWSVISDGAPTLFGNPQVLWNDMDGVTGTTDAAYLNDGQPLGGLPGGFAHALVGTLMITLIATLIAVPIGLLTSIYLVEYGRDGWLSRSIIFFVDVMTGIPSIVAGLFAFAAMSLLLELVMGEGPKALQSVKMGLTAAVALTVLMIPVVVRSTEEMLRVVPNELREGSYALGVRKWRTISKVVIPTAISGILSGITLAIARVTGETAPILVTAGFATTMNWNPMDNWMTALPVYIYRQLVSPTSPTAYDVSTDRAWAAALVLIIIVMALNLIARMIAKAFAPKTGR